MFNFENKSTADLLYYIGLQAMPLSSIAVLA